MDYTPRQQQVLYERTTEVQKGYQKLIYDEANRLYKTITRFPASKQLELIAQAREINAEYWRGWENGSSRTQGYDVWAVMLSVSIRNWQQVQTSHEQVCDELELLVPEQFLPA